MAYRWDRRAALAALVGMAASAAAPLARAATYPSRPVKLLVGAPPGGPADFLARIYGDVMGPALGQSFILDNKPGASGTLAADAVAKAAPDGQTLLVLSLIHI